MPLESYLKPCGKQSELPFYLQYFGGKKAHMDCILYVYIVDPSQDFHEGVLKGPWHPIRKHDQVEVGL